MSWRGLLYTSQAKGRPAFEREQIASVAHELCEDLISFSLWHWKGVPQR